VLGLGILTNKILHLVTSSTTPQISLPKQQLILIINSMGSALLIQPILASVIYLIKHLVQVILLVILLVAIVACIRVMSFSTMQQTSPWHSLVCYLTLETKTY
jgi:hypothetical protein